MALEGLVNEKGPMAETYPKLDANTIQYAFEITNERRDNEALRRQWFWTADSSLYRIEEDEAVLYFGGRDTNSVFKNIEDATEQLLKSNNYRPGTDDIKAVIDSEKTIRIKLSDLDLKKHSDEFSFFKINTSDYGTLNQTQRALAERVYGQGDDFIKNMEMLAQAGKKSTRVYVLNPEYVKANVKGDNAIARACWLDIFDGSSNFYASVRNVDDAVSALRGVPLVGEADTQKVEDAYELLQKSAIQPIAADLLTPESATALSQVLTLYLAKGQEQ